MTYEVFILLYIYLGYQLAMDLLTDYIEPDLCLSKDGIFVAMHDITLGSSYLYTINTYPSYSILIYCR